jgi:hypothetical protein
MSTYLHVISFDNPFPPNYGGVIDVYYKLKTLHQSGVKIILHVFEYGREPAPELERICKKVIYYKRRTFVNPFIGSLPYIVSTRNDSELLQNLLADKHPILFEGLHSCFYLNHSELASRNKMVRMHNIEHDYYRKLEEVESNFFKKYFFAKEADRLERFEPVLNYANSILAISPSDQTYLATKYKHVKLLPAFHANTTVSSMPGQSDFALYHGNLSVGENDEAARYLVNEVFNDLDERLIIAGNNPSSALKKCVEGKANIELMQNISTERINQLTHEAQINVLPTFQSTGIKLKLINVLYQGRWMVGNTTMVENTGLEALCNISDSAMGMKDLVKELMRKPFTQDAIEHRKQILQQAFSNAKNIEVLLKLIN